MANNFKIVISATDKATGAIKRINDSMSRLTRPFANVQKSMRSLSREVSQNPVVKGLSGIAQAAEGVASSVTKIAAPMAAVLGVGSIAGVAELAFSWAKLGFEIGNTSATLGVTTSDLQNWRGAAKLAGLSSEELTGSLKAFGTTLQDTAFQRNPAAQEMLTVLGLKLSKTSTGAIDTTKALFDLANILASPKLQGKAQEQGLIGRVLSVEAMLPLLRKGGAEIRRLQRDSASLNPIKDNLAIASAEAFTRQLFQMDAALDGLKQSIGSAVMPALQPLVEMLKNLISTNRDDIGKQIGLWAKQFGDWLRETDFKKVGEDLIKVGHAIGFVVEKMADMISALSKLRNVNPLKYAAGGLPRMALDYLNRDSGTHDVTGKIGVPAASTAEGTAPNTTAVVPASGSAKVRYNDPALDKYANSVEAKLGLPRNVLNSVKNFGERSNSDQVSPKGARGVMQFMPDTWKQYGKGNPTDPYASIDAGGRYFKDMLTRYRGNVDAAITEYNGGTEQGKAVASGARPWVAETKNYLDRVKGGMQQMNGGPAEMQHNFTMTIEGLPAGAQARVRNQIGQSIPVRTVMPMPAFGG